MQQLANWQGTKNNHYMYRDIDQSFLALLQRLKKLHENRCSYIM